MRRGQTLEYYEGAISIVQGIFNRDLLTEPLRLHLLAEVTVAEEEIGKKRGELNALVERFEAVAPGGAA